MLETFAVSSWIGLYNAQLTWTLKRNLYVLYIQKDWNLYIWSLDEIRLWNSFNGKFGAGTIRVRSALFCVWNQIVDPVPKQCERPQSEASSFKEGDEQAKSEQTNLFATKWAVFPICINGQH